MCWLSVLYVFQQLVKFSAFFRWVLASESQTSSFPAPSLEIFGGVEPTAHSGRANFFSRRAIAGSFSVKRESQQLTVGERILEVQPIGQNGRPLVRPDSEQVQYIDVIWFIYVLDLTVYDVLSMHIIAYQYMHINWCIFSYYLYLIWSYMVLLTCFKCATMINNNTTRWTSSSSWGCRRQDHEVAGDVFGSDALEKEGWFG